MIMDFEEKLRHKLNASLDQIRQLTNEPEAEVKCEYSGHFNNVVASIKATRVTNEQRWPDTLAEMVISEMPGNGDILVSNGVYVQPAKRGKGLGRLLNQLRIEAAKEAKASALFCTVREDNQAEQNILLANGWKKLEGTVLPSMYYQDGSIAMWLKPLQD